MNNEVFALRLEDYALPGFVSGEKKYFGYKNDIDTFMSALKLNAENVSTHKETLQAYDLFLKGKTEATHLVAHGKRQLMNKVRMIAKKNFNIPCGITWLHTNIWGYPYYMHADSCSSTYIWICDEDRYIRAVKAKFKNLSYGLEKGEKNHVTTLWGFPCVLGIDSTKEDSSSVFSRLYIPDKIFKSEDDLTQDSNVFDGLGDFTEFCNDVFADG